ncbi:hypothetical protein [Pantoea sp. SJZ147]|uniref:hypothetical protein n=1 Tax=Pantoea sp. SJZ147 TaxID=2572896 RepID=UPI0011A688E5|nr:hypothetical protein [Pantoea sp. SJZ147]TWD33778.1 hypothetical protein FBY13_11552 [Pantoea sp. SJZ147]
MYRQGAGAHVAADNSHKQYLQTANALVEIKDAGLVADALKNLSLNNGVKHGVAIAADMMAGVDKLLSVDAVMRLFNKRALAGNDYIRIADETWRTLCNGQAAGKSPRRARKRCWSNREPTA